MLDCKCENLDAGFTLIELLIVMAISSLLLSIVGPLTLESIEKAGAKQERIELRRIMNELKVEAFVKNCPVQINFKGLNVTKLDKCYTSDYEESVKKFEYLSFNTQTVSIHKNGTLQMVTLQYSVGDKMFDLVLNDFETL